ncbi:hypothetical protein MOO45_04585 [Bombilactobacillus folatiphilus]|uniref:MacB-like periplasmic core domain-containing protein n=1 Tax=Bombilactobacillus folatiphilus TaxID=2923362 RepID=A0ABY4P7E5_9LACO|nr:hypothetical protein [Bombilactobacillus folatiphilus]UQS81505.1 hypothetical protein MOO45_04585 [Bombilactobacillus folatiphilus]
MSHAQTKLPMTNGRFFSASDFQSPISFAVLGRDVAKTVYKPQYQAYYQLNDNYYSVLGVTGLKSTKKLNRHIFISTSPQQSNKTQLRHYQVVVDGPILRHSQQLKTMQKLIRARTPYRSANQINNVTQGWWTRWGGTFLILGAIAILVVILSSFVQIPTLRLLHNLNVQGDFLFDFQFGKWLQFIVTEAVVFGIALVLISVKIQIISWKYLFIYFLLLYIVVILLSALSTLLRHKNEATDEY